MTSRLAASRAVRGPVPRRYNLSVPTDALQDAIAAIRREFPRLQREFSVESLSIFGSVARGEARPDSDILVEFTPDSHIGLFEFAGLQIELEAILGRCVDLATHAALQVSMRAQILQEAVRAA